MLRLVLALAALGAASAGGSGSYTVQYIEYFSGIGSYYNSSTQSTLVTCLNEQFANANPSQVQLSAADFPVDSCFLLSGVTLHQWNSIPHVQDTFQAALAQDLNVQTSQVTLGAFDQSSSGLLVYFTVSGLGSTNTQADNIVTLINNEAGTSSGLVAALRVAGLQPVSLTVEPAPLAPAWATEPSVGLLANIVLTLPNVTAAEAVVAGNPNDLFQLGLLKQDLVANGITLGSVGGGLYVVVGSLVITAPPGGAALAPLAPNVYLTSPPPPSPSTPPGVKTSPASRAAVALSALMLAMVAALL